MKSANETEVLARGKYLQLVKKNRWEYCERVVGTGVVLIVAVTDRRELLLVEQYRPSVGAPVLEVPAGLVGDTNEESLTAAAERELLEETGYEAGQISFLTRGPISAGLTNETLDWVRAEKLTQRTAGGGDATEAITVHAVPLNEVEKFAEARAAQGTQIDPKIFAALYFAGASR